GSQARDRRMTTSAMPPSTAADASMRRTLNGSPSSTIPPTAAMTGTLSCAVAAVVTVSPGSAEYQIAYSTPDANAPDATAQASPKPSNENHGRVTRLKAAAGTTARMKLPAVTRNG